MEVTNKKIEGLRRKRERWVRGAEGQEGTVKLYYENQGRMIDYDIEDAVRVEVKRRTRKALRHIEKRLEEVKELRATVDGFLNEKVLGWSEWISFEEELEQGFDLKRLRWGSD